MSESLLLHKPANITTKVPAPVISIRSVVKNHKQREEAPKMKAEKKIPLFYTKPIFKSKKYDFF